MDARLTDWLFPRAANVDPLWLCHLFDLEPALARRYLASPVNARRADRRVQAHCGPPQRPAETLAALCVAGDRARRRCAMRLGWRALAPTMRQVVAGEQVIALIAQVGQQRYRRCLGMDDHVVAGFDGIEAAFAQAARQRTLGALALGTGIAVLEALFADEPPFARRRLSLCVPPQCWASRPRGLMPTRDGAATAVDLIEAAA